MHIPRRKGAYGIDAPKVPLLMGLGTLACVGMAVVAGLHQWWTSAVILALMLACYLHTTLRGKFVVWRSVLEAQPWHGDERVLDMGCGRGAILMMVASCVPRGCATGVDIWSSTDQSGNDMDAAARNAVAEDVAPRVELKTADMRELPFDDASFDAVVSNLAIHNIAAATGREKAIDEAWRVLRPRGHLLIADILHSRQYQTRLLALGAEADRRSLGWRMWWGGPWMTTMLVSARKPAESGIAPPRVN